MFFAKCIEKPPFGFEISLRALCSRYAGKLRIACAASFMQMGRRSRATQKLRNEGQNRAGVRSPQWGLTQADVD
jgi:hypothetical protein